MAFKDISDLDPATALDGTELVELEQGGASARTTIRDLTSAAVKVLDDAEAFPLPTTPIDDERIVVFNRGIEAFITQSDVEHGISYLNKFFTTPGAAGQIRLGPKDRIELVYIGTGASRIEPGVKLSDPATLPAGDGDGAAFSPDGMYLAIAHDTSPYLTIYKRSGDTFTKLSAPATTPTGIGLGAAFSPDGAHLAIAHDTSSYLTIYKNVEDITKAWIVSQYETQSPALLPWRLE
jgi:hypothetical protein